jgi:FkbM family methyltransferase
MPKVSTRLKDALPEWFHVPKGTLFWMQKDLDGNPFEHVIVKPGDVVMDCGACVGTFSAWALHQGARLTVAWEPEPRNFAQLTANMEPFGNRARCVNAALVPGAAKTVNLICSGFTGAHSVVRGKGKKVITVAARRFRDELFAIKPQVLKVDVESAEYDLFDSLRPGDLDGVRSAFVEFHPIEGKDERMARVKRFVLDHGFRELCAVPRRWTAEAMR